MKTTLISLAALAMLSAMPASGQSKRQSQAAAKAQAAKAAKEAEQRIEQMVAATQKVMFIDSVVVDKDAFLTKYNLCQDAGRLYKYDDFFKAKDQANAYVYVNGLGDKCYFSREDSVGDFNLYTSDNLSGSWTPAARLDGLDDDAGHKSMNYPFMMADGSTLYFAATGDESIGGYDIFATRFDSERGTFLKAENIGMPFNSTANDYMYAIDEFNNIGWFATDRNQSEGKVCIYMFVPSDSRQLYSPDEYSEEQIRSLANLNRIADTWGDGKERQLAMERLKAMQSEKIAMAAKGSFSFVVNDKTTYTKMADFRSKAGLEKFKALQELESKHAALSKALAKARDYYATASTNERNALKNEILQSERQIESLETNIAQTGKEIRNEENKLLK